MAEEIYKENQIPTPLLGEVVQPSQVSGYDAASRRGMRWETGGRQYDAVVALSGGDYTNIADAITAGKKRIFVRGGTYTLQSSLVIAASDVVIVGEDWSTTILKAKDSLNADLVEIGDGSSAYENITLYNIQIDGNTDNNTSGACIHIRDDITNLTIEHCDIHSSDEQAIKFQADSGTCATNANIINNLIHDTTDGSGIEVNNCHQTYIQGNRIYDIGDDPGIDIDASSEDTFVVNNFITSGTGRGITVSAGSSIIMGNTITDNDDVGIFINTRNNIIANNYLSDNNLSSSSTDKAEIAVHQSGNSITGNVIVISSDGYDDYGIFLDAQNITCIGNNLEHNGVGNNDTGIYLDQNASYNLIIGNSIEDFGTDVGEHASSANNDISHNMYT